LYGDVILGNTVKGHLKFDPASLGSGDFPEAAFFAHLDSFD
jgi:hypothetical protein